MATGVWTRRRPGRIISHLTIRPHLSWLRKLLEKKEEGRMMQDIVDSVEEGKVKVAKMFDEFLESFTSSFENERKKFERQYVSEL